MGEYYTNEFLSSRVEINPIIDVNKGIELFSLGVIEISQVCHTDDIKFHNLYIDRSEYYIHPFIEYSNRYGLLPRDYRNILKIDSFEIHSSDNIYQSDMPEQIGKILECIDNLCQQEPDLEDYGTLPPDDECVSEAKHLVIRLMTRIYSSELKWIEPYISSDELGRIILEWYNNNRQLHVIIDNDDAEYITFCKINNHPEMRDGNFNINNYMLHWEWLVNE